MVRSETQRVNAPDEPVRLDDAEGDGAQWVDSAGTNRNRAVAPGERGASHVEEKLPTAGEGGVDRAVAERRPERGDEQNRKHRDRGRGGGGRAENVRGKDDDGGRGKHRCTERDSGVVYVPTDRSIPLIQIVDGGHGSSSKLWRDPNIFTEVIINRY